MGRTKKRRRTRLTEPWETSSLEETLAVLDERDRSLSVEELAGLSNLGPAELGRWRRVWADIEPARRRQVVAWLVEFAEQNIELDFEAVFKYCLRDEDAAVRCQAIEGLWESEDTSLISPLLGMLVEDASADVQAAAATALGRFALMAELNKLRSDYTAEIAGTLLTVFHDGDRPVAVRRRALEAAAPLNLPEVTGAINEAYHGDNLRLRASAVYAMGRNCNVVWLPQLLQELDSTEDELRYEAAGACGELGEAEAVPGLIKLTNDTDGDVQRAAIEALGKIGGKEAKEHLEHCLDHPSQAVRESAESALAELEAGDDLLSFRRML